MAELVIKIPEDLEKEIEELSVDKSKFALEAMKVVLLFKVEKGIIFFDRLIHHDKAYRKSFLS